MNVRLTKKDSKILMLVGYSHTVSFFCEISCNVALLHFCCKTFDERDETVTR